MRETLKRAREAREEAEERAAVTLVGIRASKRLRKIAGEGKF